jgi:hypothetical protein
MFKHRGMRSGVIAAALLLALSAGEAYGQARTAAPAAAPAAQAPRPVASDKELAETREQLMKLLRMSPTLTTVVARDASLLSDQEYVRRNNPALAQFLVEHPEVASNPDFYLFADLNGVGEDAGDALERRAWPQLNHGPEESQAVRFIQNGVGPFLFFICILGALLWLIHTLLENRRWGRIFKLQTEVHGKLIDKFGTNQELLTYMDTEAGKRFLEAAPIPVDLDNGQRMPNAVARVLTPLQIGIVLSLLGSGFLYMRHSIAEIEQALFVLGVMGLMVGLGLILSAAITWLLAVRLGLMPEKNDALAKGGAIYDAKERL